MTPVEYVHRARRLRLIYEHRPAKLHQSLRELSHHAELQRVAQLSVAIPTKSPGKAQAFADLVAKQLEGQALRYSKRLALLRDAERRGIERFEANLIIAAVQHRAPRERETKSPRSNRRVSFSIVAFVLVQSIILIAVYKVLGT